MPVPSVLHSSSPPSVWSHFNPVAMAASLWRSRHLTWQVASRDLATRYKQTYLGGLWTLINPLATMGIFVLAFGFILVDPSSPASGRSVPNFAVQLFACLLVFGVFTECVSAAPRLVSSRREFVTRVVFPIEVLPVSALIVALANMAFGFVVWLLGYLVLWQDLPPWTVVFFPLVLLPLCLLTLALSWVLASLGVFIRDMGPAVTLGVQLIFWGSPIVYEISRVPPSLRPLFNLNPLTHVMEQSRAVLIGGQMPDFAWLGLATLASLVLAVLGYGFFSKSKRAFADVL